MNVPAYASVTVNAIYQGVDLIYYGTEGRIEYDLRIAPHTDPSKIRMRIAGARQVSVDANGALVICSEGSCLRQLRPHAWQEERGRRRRVSAAYDLQGGAVGFRLGPWDPSLALIIDPILEYSTYLGGSQFEGATGIAVDSTGNTLVTGQTQSADFPLLNAYDSTYSGFSEAFVVKLNPAGQLVYATYFGGSGDDTPLDIAIDGLGNAYIIGDTTSADFPIAGGFDSSLGSFRDGYVFILSPTGSLLHSTYLGGNGEEIARGIAVDPTGRVLVTGETQSTNFPTTPGAIDTTYNGTGDAFITVLSASLASVTYSTYFGSTGNENAAGIASDPTGNIFVTGVTGSSGFPTLNAIDTTLSGIQDAFLLKLTPSGSLVFSTFLGGAAIDATAGVAVDVAGAAYVTGRTESADFPVTPGAFDVTLGGSSDAFVSKFDGAGTLNYSTFLGGSFSDQGFGVAVNASGNAHVTGLTAGFPLVQPIDSTLGGSADAFVAKLTPDGGNLVYSTYLGGSDVDSGTSIAAAGDVVHVAGTTLSSNFPVTANAIQTTRRGTHDAFVARISGAPETTTTTLTSSPNPSFIGQSVTLSAVVSGGSVTPTGTITFRDGGTTLGVVPIVSGSATLSTSSLAAGTHNLVAVYGGDPAHEASTSNIVVHFVLDAGGAPTLGAFALLALALSLGFIGLMLIRD